MASTVSRAEYPSELEQLLEGYQRGDRHAAAALVDRVSPQFIRYCLSQGDPPQDAEDLLQEIWLRIHKARHTYRPGEPAAPWLYAIARHTRLDAYRRRYRARTREVAIGEVPDPPAPAPQNAASRFAELLDRLPPGEREVITMLKGMGMSLEETARATASTAGAVKQKAHRAYKRLRRLMAASPAEEAT